MESRHIITIEEFKELARPTSKHVDEDEVMSFVRECEDMYIEPAIGLDKYRAMLTDEISDEDKVLLEGGSYKDKDKKDFTCHGLKKTLAYYVYAKMTMADGGVMTRSGVVQHNDSYAARQDDKNRVRRYDDAMNVAEAYLETCLAYLKTMKGYEEHSKLRGTRIRIHSIGD